MKLLQYAFYEMQKGKGRVDQHFATLTHKFRQFHQSGMLHQLIF